MIELNITTITGLVGVTLVIATGKIFDGPRGWLKGFANAWNPLRWLGEGMGCTMCAGWWVGFWWGVYSGSDPLASVVVGGVVSVASYLADELLAIVAAVSLRLVIRRVPVAQAAPMTLRPQMAPEDRPLSEEEAHIVADDEERHADGTV